METRPIKPSRRISRSLQVEVFFRECWLCRYCKRPVIFAPAMKYLQKELDCADPEGLAYWRYAYDRNGAPLLDELAAVIDHVKPFSGGGPGELDNLATACNKCNTRKNNSNAQEWAAKNPIKPIKSRHGEPTAWDGFASVFLHFACRYQDDLSQSEKDWRKILETRVRGAASQAQS